MAVLGQKSVARLGRKRFLRNDPVAGPGVGQYQMYPHKPPAEQEVDRELSLSRRPRPFSSNSNTQATPGPTSARSIFAILPPTRA